MTSGKVSEPSDGVRAPSATVFGLCTVCSVFVLNDRDALDGQSLIARALKNRASLKLTGA
jgi:hypothetical protein